MSLKPCTVTYVSGVYVFLAAAECSSSKQIITEVIKGVVAPSTGDEGNPYYAEELNESSGDYVNVA